MKLTLSLAQIPVVNSKPEENLKKAEKLIAEAKKKGSRLICFPEMWTTGLSWFSDKGLLKNSAAVMERVAAMARRNSIWINGSMLALNEKGKPTNASVLFDDKGKSAGVYRKIHLFGPLGEDKHMAAGDSLCAADTPWGLFGLSICYDIRFPEIFRAYALQGVKVILCPAAFPKERIADWKGLLRARAIEAQVFMAGINRIGGEEVGAAGRVEYGGSSAVIGPGGETVSEASERQEELLTATIDTAEVEKARVGLCGF